ADEAIFDKIEPPDAVGTAELIELPEQRSRRRLLSVNGNRITALEINRDVGRLVRRLLGIDRAGENVIRNVLRGIFQNLPFRGRMQQIGVNGEWPLASLSPRDLDEFGARGPRPPPPRRDHRYMGLERIVGQFKANLIVAFAGRAMRNSIGTDFLRYFDLFLRDQRSRDRRAKQILAFVKRVCPKHREYVVAHEFFAQVLNEDVFLFDAEERRLLPGRLELLTLTEIGCKGDDLAAIDGLQPLQNNRGIEPAGIGENDFLYSLFGLAVGHQKTSALKTRRTIGRKVYGAKYVLVRIL